MPAKVLEPDGNTMGTPSGVPNCGYLVRADVPPDSLGELKRIPFINDKGLVAGDIVMIEEVKPYNAILVSTKSSSDISSGYLMIAKIGDEYFNDSWNKNFQEKWKDKWNDKLNVTDDNIKKLKLKSDVGRQEVAKCMRKSDVEKIRSR